MRVNLPFENLDFSEGFQEYDGGIVGISQKILVDDRDTVAGTGKRTRLLRLAPGVQTPAAHDHPHWEEIYVIQGSMIEGMPETGKNRITAPAYACRKPGFMHGPIRTGEECLLIEFSWYDEAAT